MAKRSRIHAAVGSDVTLNAAWHRDHPMPKNPTLEDRVRWHEEHAAACGCRPIPAGIRKEMERRERRQA